MERELVLRAQGGDHDAFSELCAVHLGRLNAIARLILHDEYLAREAVQDALIDAWRGIRGLRDPDRLEAWFRRLLVHACHGRARAQWRRQVNEISLPAGLEPAVASDTAQVERRDQLQRGLRQLGPDQRAVLVLTYYLDLPLADAAAALDIPLGTMKSRLNRATQALRAAVEADDRPPALSTRAIY